jgi:hypothetical protein
MEITFKRMTLLEDLKVDVIGDCEGQEVHIRLSILQLAKAFGTDKEAVSKTENGHGSEQLEEACAETRTIIEKFPDVELSGNDIEFYDVDTRKANVYFDENLIVVFGEDLCGWNGEGVQVHVPLPIYERELEGKDYRMVLKARSVEFLV